MNGKTITREILSSLIANDGRFKNMTQEERNKFVKNMFKTTKKHILGKNRIIPIIKGHKDKEENLRGFIRNMKLKDKIFTSENGEQIKYVAVESDIFLNENMYEDYKDKRLPGASVEMSDKGVEPDGTVFGPHIFRVAMLGKTIPAFPDLEAQFSQLKTLEDIANTSYCFASNISQERFYMPDENKEKFQTGDEFLQVLMQVKAMLEELVKQKEVKASESDVQDAASEKPEEEEKKKEEEEEMESENNAFESAKTVLKEQADTIRAERQKLQSEKIELCFQKLSTDGKITVGEKESFEKIANANGLEFANSFWDKRTAEQPPVGETFGSGKGKETTGESQNDKETYQTCYKYLKEELEYTDAQIEKTIGSNGNNIKQEA